MSGQAMPVYRTRGSRGSRRRAFSPACANGHEVVEEALGAGEDLLRCFLCVFFVLIEMKLADESRGKKRERGSTGAEKKKISVGEKILKSER